MGNFIPSATAMFKRECLDNVGLFDEALRGGADDYDLWLRIAAEYKLEYLPISLAFHRFHGANYSNTKQLFRDSLLIMEKVLAREPSLKDLKQQRLAVLYYGLGRYYQQKAKFRQARGMLWKAVKYRPMYTRAAAAFCLCHFGHLGNWALEAQSLVRSRIRRALCSWTTLK